MKPTLALRISWGIFVIAVVVAIATCAALAQSPAFCLDGVCMVPESELRGWLEYMMKLEKQINDLKCI